MTLLSREITGKQFTYPLRIRWRFLYDYRQGKISLFIVLLFMWYTVVGRIMAWPVPSGKSRRQDLMWWRLMFPWNWHEKKYAEKSERYMQQILTFLTETLDLKIAQKSLGFTLLCHLRSVYLCRIFWWSYPMADRFRREGVRKVFGCSAGRSISFGRCIGSMLYARRWQMSRSPVNRKGKKGFSWSR